MFDFSVGIADRNIRFKCGDDRVEYNPRTEKEFRDFVSPNKGNGDIEFDVEYGWTPAFEGKEALFSVDDGWALSKFNEKMLFEYFDRSIPGRLDRAGLINRDFTKGIIYVNREKNDEEKETAKRFREEKRRRQGRPVKKKKNKKSKKPRKKGPDTPLDIGRRVMSGIKANFFQAFLVEYLIHMKVGIMLHTSAVFHKGRLMLFLGPSGAGKSTMADFWIGKEKAVVFNDDRAVLSIRDGRPFYHNAPWVGTLSGKCSLKEGRGVFVDHMFFIRHSKSNNMKRIPVVLAATAIFRNSFPVFWEKRSVNYAFDVCAKIAKSVPCYDLGFVNNDSIVDFLKKEIGI